MVSWLEISWLKATILYVFVVEVLRPSQPNGVMSSAVSLPNHTFTGQAWSSKWLTSIVHILSPETDNCPSWISGRERMTVEIISWSISTKECCRPRRGLNPRPPGLQSDGASNWATEAGSHFVWLLWQNLSRKLVKHQQGEKTSWCTSRERRPCDVPAGKEDPVKHQQRKKTHAELVSCQFLALETILFSLVAPFKQFW